MSFQRGSVYEALRDNANHRSEAETAKFWVHYLRSKVFTNPDVWIVSQEQHPRPYDDLRKIDIQVDYYNTSVPVLNVFSVGEAKSGKAGHREILNVEQQAFNRSNEVLEHTEREAVWAMTFYGSRARLWACCRGKRHLEPVYPLDKERGKKELYKDIKHHEDAILKRFEYLMQFPTPTAFTVQSAVACLAEEAQMVDNSAIYVSVHSRGEGCFNCWTDEGEWVYPGMKWFRMLGISNGQLYYCYTTSDSGGGYWTWTLTV